MTDSREAERASGLARSREHAEIRARVQEVSSSAWTAFLVPVLFFVLSLILASLEESDQISQTVQWIALSVLGVFALVLTLATLNKQQLTRRGYRLIACSLIIYLLAVRAAISAEREWGFTGFLVVFVIALAVIVILGQIGRRRETPVRGSSFVDLTSDDKLRPAVVALAMADRARQSAVATASGLSESDADEAVRKLEQHSYVTVRPSKDGDPVIRPTRFLRVAARLAQRAWEVKARRGLPSWLEDRS